MKKLAFAFFFVFLFSMFPANIFAYNSGFEAGISNEQEYKEVVFITGEPVVFSGFLKVTSSKRGDTTTTTYRYTLSTPSGDKLTRTLTFVTEEKQKPEYNQIIAETTLKNYTESIKIGGDTYTLDRNNGYIYQGSEVKSINPAVTYYAGNYSGSKVYRMNGNKGTVKVSIEDKTVGFSHKYGSAETHQMCYQIEATIGTGNNVKKWVGEAQVNVSFADKSSIEYVENDPQYISFRGGYLLRRNSEDVMTYAYNLPKFDENGNEIGRNTGSNSLRLDGIYTENRLVVPEVRDISGTWGKDDINKLLSLEIFPKDSLYFGPKLYILRSDFAVAVAKAIGIAPYEPPKNALYSTRKMPVEVSPFKDVPTNDPNYGYIKAASDIGLISGIGPSQFGPSLPLTRAQAAVIFIRALGLENLAPQGYFKTGFLDDSSIPLWAKRSVYVVREIGLVGGDTFGRFNPESYVTREEAASMISRMIDFMMKDLTFDYVERVLNFR
ncbi:S-layer protein [Caldanaerobacter subterraneus subsp. yonseiensis KB-1]|uniref:S-layer protein n=1 Tax=Caldanaerobacter subterraneus subsp. yonseiensis KB-1 TaxID=1388761 RepID=U5CUN1_CALSX|nr:S-layer homology domain-containing protein [Caldanaerobacter subterraneus]ERM92646.1 S-layer protein [Caldanaerobacter subterraneus subsp. yonseiensis KB-1]